MRHPPYLNRYGLYTFIYGFIDLGTWARAQDIFFSVCKLGSHLHHKLGADFGLAQTLIVSPTEPLCK